MEYNVALLPMGLLTRVCEHPLLAEKFACIDRSRFVSMMQCVLGLMLQGDKGGDAPSEDVLKRAHSNVVISDEEVGAWTECLEAAMRDLSLDALIPMTLASVRRTMAVIMQAQERRASIDRMSEKHGRGEDITSELNILRSF